MQSRRDWLKASSMGIGGLMMAPTNILTAQEKDKFHSKKFRPDCSIEFK